jgi:hypothetical protein
VFALCNFQLVTSEEEPRLIVSVMKYQTLSMQQHGISDIKMTFGEGQMYSFLQRQQFMKSTKKPYYTIIRGDLSGYLGLSIHLWVKAGKGQDCICDLMPQEKPKNTSLFALRGRCNTYSQRGVQIAWHESVHVEVHGICSLKQGKSGFAVQDIRICSTPEEIHQAQQDGFRNTGELMKFNFPSSIWVLGRKQEIDEKTAFKLGNMPSMEWWNARAEKCIKVLPFILQENI